VLLFDLQAGFSQAMHQGVFIHFFQMPVLVIAVNVKSRLPDHVGQFHNVFHLIAFLGWPLKTPFARLRKSVLLLRLLRLFAAD
jgi:hypothetical protein